MGTIRIVCLIAMKVRLPISCRQQWRNDNVRISYIIKILLETAMVDAGRLEYYRDCISFALLLHHLNGFRQCFKAIFRIVQHFRLPQGMA